MKRSRIIAILILCAFLPSCKSILMNRYSRSVNKFNGRSFPDLRLFDLENKPFDLASHRGKVTMINLWGTWCGPCLVMLPEINALAEHTSDDPDLQIINVCVDCDFDAWQRVVCENNLLGINLIAGQEAYGLINNFNDNAGYPFDAVLNQDGVLLASNIMQSGNAQIMTLYALVKAKEGWTGAESVKDVMIESQKKVSKRADGSHFWNFMEQHGEKFAAPLK